MRLGVGAEYAFGHQIFVAVGGVACNEFGSEACEEELCAENHEDQREIEIGAGGDEWHIPVVVNEPEFFAPKPSSGNEAKEEHEGAEGSEEVHGSFAELAHECYGEEIEEAFDGSLDAKFGVTEFAFVVLNDLFANFAEACFFGQEGNIAVHLAIDFYGFDNV